MNRHPRTCWKRQRMPQRDCILDGRSGLITQLVLELVKPFALSGLTHRGRRKGHIHSFPKDTHHFPANWKYECMVHCTEVEGRLSQYHYFKDSVSHCRLRFAQGWSQSRPDRIDNLGHLQGASVVDFAHDTRIAYRSLHLQSHVHSTEVNGYTRRSRCYHCACNMAPGDFPRVHAVRASPYFLNGTIFSEQLTTMTTLHRKNVIRGQHWLCQDRIGFRQRLELTRNSSRSTMLTLTASVPFSNSSLSRAFKLLQACLVARQTLAVIARSPSVVCNCTTMERENM